MKRKSVFLSIISISALGIVAKASGLFREGVTAAYFGTSAQMDVFGLLTGYATMLMSVLAGSLAISFSPYYVKDIEQRGEVTAAERFSHALNQYVLFTAAFILLVWWATPFLASIVSHSTPGVGIEKVTVYIRLLFATIMTGGMSRLFVSSLNGLRKYGWMQITQILYSFITIVLVIFFGHQYGVDALVAAFLLNSFIQVAILWGVFYRDGRKYNFSLGVKDPVTRSSWKAIIPVFFGTEIYMLGLAIDRTVGLTLHMDGAVAALNYAGILFGLINTVVTRPISTVFNTEMYRNYFKNENRDALYGDLGKIINHQAIILLPVGFFLFTSTSDFITLVLRRGAFDDYSVWMTASAFCMYALSAPAYALRSVFTGVHIAMHDQTTPMWSGIIYLILNAFLSFALSRIIGITGITLGALCSMLVSFAFQYSSIMKKHECHHRLFTMTYIKIFISAFVASIPVFIFARLQVIPSPYLRLLVNAIAYCGIYITILHFSHCKEYVLLKQRIAKKSNK